MRLRPITKVVFKPRYRAIVLGLLFLASSAWLLSTWLQQLLKQPNFLNIPVSLALAYDFGLIPLAILILTFFAKNAPIRRAPKNLKVAVITLCVPSSESLAIIEKQLQAMVAIRYPHDSWILDEGKSLAIKKLAKKYHVKYFSRKGIRKYNQTSFPFQTRSKAGNVNAWLDKTKRYKYDFFVQLDIDHLPKANYLNKTLGYFRDKNIAYVQSPSVYGNLDSWTARGSAEQEMAMHGIMQMGYYGLTNTPIIVGSHACYRTSAIREIGGFQPTRAEDQLNTLVLASHGYKGVFLNEILAVGDGPETFSAYLTQQYAWARSVSQVIKSYSFRYLKKCNFGQQLQFSFLQSWYILSAISFFILYLTPIVALIFKINVINLSFTTFLIHVLPFILTDILILASAKPLMQPKKLHYSYRGILLHLIRWPVIWLAIISALFNIDKPYMVTPKGKFLDKFTTLKIYRPFIFLGLLSTLAILLNIVFIKSHFSQISQLIFAGYDALIMIGICLIDIHHQLKVRSLKTFAIHKTWLKPISVTMLTFLVVSSVLTYSISGYVKTSLALSSPPLSQFIRLENKPIDQLTNSELAEQISAQQYKHPANYKTPSLGLYSPNISFVNTKPFIDSIFIDWRADWMLARSLVQANRMQATALVTIEPKGEQNGLQLLNDIASGKYNHRLLKALNLIKLDPNTVYVRFAQEMDLPNSFNWGNQNPASYIDAYRQVVNLARSQHITNIKWVWSPAGLPTAINYYPGNNYVNIIGTTMLYDPYWSGSYKPTFQQIQAVRAWLLTLNKPVWITEFGVGDEKISFQTKLLNEALSQYRADGYSALIYMNIVDPNAHGPDYILPSINELGPTFVQTTIFKIHQPKTQPKIQLPSRVQTKITKPTIFKPIQTLTQPQILKILEKSKSSALAQINQSKPKHSKVIKTQPKLSKVYPKKLPIIQLTNLHSQKNKSLTANLSILPKKILINRQILKLSQPS